MRARQRRGGGAHPRDPRHRRSPSPDARVPRPGRTSGVTRGSTTGSSASCGKVCPGATRSCCQRRARYRAGSSIRTGAPSACAFRIIRWRTHCSPSSREPMLSSTLIPIGETAPLNDADAIRERYERQVDAVVDAGPCAAEMTTVVDLAVAPPVGHRAAAAAIPPARADASAATPRRPGPISGRMAADGFVACDRSCCRRCRSSWRSRCTKRPMATWPGCSATRRHGCWAG